MAPTPLKTFIIYAHEDRSTVNAIRGQLRIFEKKKTLQIWDDGEILAGQDWNESIKLKLESAQLILLFISVDFINSEYIEKTELKAALQRHDKGEAKLIPIIVRSCSWEEYFELGKFQALPPQARPIRSYDLHSIDEAYYAVALGIKAAADEMQQKLAAAEGARQAEIERENRQKAEAEKQKQKNERLQKQDKVAWNVALTAIEKAKTEREKMDVLEVYLDEPNHKLHRVEAENQFEALKAAETVRKIEEKQREQQRLESEQKKRATEQAEEERKVQEAYSLAELERKTRVAEQAENERKKREAEEQKKAQEAALLLLTELKKQKEVEKGLPEMVLVRAGTFRMGSYDNDSEKPIHSVMLPDFEIGKYPVTQKFWQEIMGNNPSFFKGYGDCPVEQVSWNDVQEFLKALNQKHLGKNYRLATEAEWEYAARGGKESKGYTYAGSHNIDEVAWCDKNSRGKTQPVGGKKANELGIYDLSGNVWEWCQDAWHDNYQGAPTHGSARDGESKDAFRVLRGGSWYNYPINCRVSNRFWNDQNTSNYFIGFRLARH